jgi:serine protease DegQ
MRAPRVAVALLLAAVAIAACEGTARAPGFRTFAPTDAAAPRAATPSAGVSAAPSDGATPVPEASPAPSAPPTAIPPSIAAETMEPSAEASLEPSGAPGASPPAVGGVPASPAAPTDMRSAWDRIPEIVATLEPSVVTVLTDLGLGSGVVWDPDGVIVTNNHVVAGASAVQVAFADGERADATVVATDPRTDLAVLQTGRIDLPAATFSRDLPLVGSLAIAIGSPLGLEETVTAGIISGLHREVPGSATQSSALVDLLQTDAAISPGNSGGALVNADGAVIGINVAYLPPAGGAVSIGFAIPSPTVIDVVGQLLDTGRVAHAYLGIQPAQLTPEIAQQFGLSVTSGVVVVDVGADAPAARAGIEPGDVIVGIDEETIETVEDFLGAMRRHAPGERVTITLVRGADSLELEAVLADLPS